MRPEAKLDLGGCMTTQPKWYQINYRGCPKSLNAYPRPKIQKNQTSHMRPEAKLDLQGHMTTQSKWYQINYRGRPKCLNAYPRPKIQKKSFN